MRCLRHARPLLLRHIGRHRNLRSKRPAHRLDSAAGQRAGDKHRSLRPGAELALRAIGWQSLQTQSQREGLRHILAADFEMKWELLSSAPFGADGKTTVFE